MEDRNFSTEDLARNRTWAALGYLLFFIPLIKCKHSPLGRYCANQGLLLLIVIAIVRILFTGDMEHTEEAALLASGADLRCDVLKVANHGDSDATSAALIAACAPVAAVISTDSTEKPGTPDPGIVRNLQSIGCAVCVTQDASLGVRIALDGGRVAVENVNP